MQTKELIERRAAYLTKQTEELEKQISKFPKGTLQSYPQKNHYKYWISFKDRDRVYLPKSNPALIRKMANKKFLESSLIDSRAELHACESYLRALETQPIKAMDKLLKNKGICDYLPQSNKFANLDKWIHEPYEKNPHHKESLTVPTITGEMVRSKSESLFLQTLYSMGIPYHYEQKLRLDGIDFYPDFTLLRPRDNKIFIAELFGMMDDSDYANHAMRKLRTYIRNGYYPDDNLLCFYETGTHPFDISFVKTTLDYFMA